MDSLPETVIILILSFLEVEEVARCLCISRAWKACSQYPEIRQRVILAKPTGIARKIGHEDLLEAVEKEVNSTYPDLMDSSPLMFAASKGYLTLTKALIEAGADINGATILGQTALWTAAYHGHLDIVETLIHSGAHVNATDRDGVTALIAAATYSDFSVSEALIRSGANVNAADKQGWTALMSAALQGKLRLTEALLRSGADVHAKNKDGSTALWYARDVGNYEVLDVLLTKVWPTDATKTLDTVL